MIGIRAVRRTDRRFAFWNRVALIEVGADAKAPGGDGRRAGLYRAFTGTGTRGRGWGAPDLRRDRRDRRDTAEP